MLKKLMQKLQGLVESSGSAFDPSVFGDPLAMETGWKPAKGGGSNFRTHKLIEVNPDRLEFQSSIGAKLFSLIFLLVGLGVMIGFSVINFSSGGLSFNIDTIIPLFFGLVFACAGGFMFYAFSAPVVFDRRKGYFWKGRTAPDEVVRRDRLKHFAEIDNIHALQLISEYCSGNKSSYYSYELNLVLENGQRINVVDHGNSNKLREDTQKLAAFLDKPVWDAI